MNTKAEAILIRGLKAGYAGGETPIVITRGPFVGKESALSFPDLNADYNDQWFFKRTGGGQDIARSGDEMATRVFAGGIVKPDILKKLGISEDQVLAYHKQKLSTLASTTRLHDDVVVPADGDWQYTYQIMKDYPDLLLTVGVETISYKNTDVFVHVFLNTPIA